VTVLEFFYGNEGRNVGDYRLMVRKEREPGGGGWQYKLCFLCLNPAVAFMPLVRMPLLLLLKRQFSFYAERVIPHS
jgi:hypothetical protein